MEGPHKLTVKEHLNLFLAFQRLCTEVTGTKPAEILVDDLIEVLVEAGIIRLPQELCPMCKRYSVIELKASQLAEKLYYCTDCKQLVVK